MKNLIFDFLGKIKAEDGLSKNTIISYQKDLELLEDFLIEISHSLRTASSEDIKKYLHSLHNKKLKSSSLLRKISSIRGFYKFLSDEKIITQHLKSHMFFCRKCALFSEIRSRKFSA
jgi:site-specific recombinase XerD